MWPHTRLVILIAITQTAFFGCSSPEADAASLNGLIEEDWEWTLETYLTFATVLGDRRYNDRLEDLRPAAIEARQQYARDMLVALQKMDGDRFTGHDKLNYTLFRRNFEEEVAGHAFPTHLVPVNQMGGVQIDLPSMYSFTPFDNIEDYRNYLARLGQIPEHIAQTIDLMRQGMARGWVPPKVPLRSLPGQIQAQTEGPVEESPFYSPFSDIPDEIDATDREELASEARRILTEDVRPAYVAMLKFVEDDYLPAAPDEVGAWSLPNGEAYYAHRVRTMTTTDRTSDEIHEIGLSEVARIRGEMLKIVKETGFGDDFMAFAEFLRTDPRFYGHTPEQRLNGYRDITSRLNAALPTLFARLPKATFTVEPIPDYAAPAAPGAYYRQPAADGSRPGTFFANTTHLDTRPNYSMESLAIHETVPGHHFQIAIAQELEDLPDFRKNGLLNAYVEGWALYAEGLGEDLGFYRDPYSKYGQLGSELFRAIRLVVDTGLHYKRWSRQQAIDYFQESLGRSGPSIISEVDRYIVWPGQALGYKMGQLTIKGLREKAESELGLKFDIKKFHDAILEQGALPLSILEEQINGWIESRAKANLEPPQTGY